MPIRPYFVQSNKGRMPTRNATLPRLEGNPGSWPYIPVFSSSVGGLALGREEFAPYSLQLGDRPVER